MSAKYESIKTALTQSTDESAPHNKRDGYRSNGVVISIGGAQESLFSRPGEYRIVIKKRKGFVKAALETGASLVPVFSFGEGKEKSNFERKILMQKFVVDVYDQVEGPKLRKFQELLKKLTGISPVIFIGRSFLPIGGIPKRCPINTIVGAPIEITRIQSPSQSDIDNLHRRFTEDLEKLFEEHKWTYLPNAKDVKLIME
jgi:2-acylglycerol O-acyltransferase 2